MGVVSVGMGVGVRMVGRLGEGGGGERATLELPAGSTVAEVYEALRRMHSALEADRHAVRAALNQEFKDWSAEVADGDEVAFIPPVSGGAHGVGILFELTPDPLDARRMEAAGPHKGADPVCTFTGVVRDNSRGHSVTHLDYEAYAA